MFSAFAVRISTLLCNFKGFTLNKANQVCDVNSY